jgi:hypothetical protein
METQWPAWAPGLRKLLQGFSIRVVFGPNQKMAGEKSGKKRDVWQGAFEEIFRRTKVAKIKEP